MNQLNKAIQATCIACALLLMTLDTYGQGGGKTAGTGMLVSVSWLAENQKDPSLVILHVASIRRDYSNGHIPGARFLWTNAMASSNPDLTYEVPSIQQLDTTLKALGVNDDSRIILYGSGGNVTIVTRMFFTLDYLGLGGRTAILDGGLDAWKAGGHPVSKEPASFKRGNATLQPNASLVATWDVVRSAVDKPGFSIIDARGQQFYQGNGGGMPRAGHIPSAKNIPFSTVVDSTNKMKSVAELTKMFTEAGVKQGDNVVTYCHIGQQATLLYFTAKYLGYNVRLYDGSFEDWSGREEGPVVNPSGTKSQ
ncbi:MAG: sulfurtransferase [Ignavibacteriales bacterium]|nr:sulfurtransferase [Ignavibacteriales bacterium]